MSKNFRKLLQQELQKTAGNCFSGIGCCVRGVKDTKLVTVNSVEEFFSIVDNPENADLIRRYRNGEAKEETKCRLPLFCFHGVPDYAKYREYELEHEVYLADWKRRKEAGEVVEKKKKKEGLRSARFLIAVNRRLIDLDHIDDPKAMWEYAKDKLEQLGLMQHLLLAHLTPSGKGLRLILETLPSMEAKSIEDGQKEWYDILSLPIPQEKKDEKVKDLARGSFAPLREDILHLDQRLFSPVQIEYVPSAPARKKSPKITATATKPATSDTVEMNHYPKDYMGIPYQDIISALEMELGGEPKEGKRNNFLLKMAQHMAFITDKNPDHLAAILPRYGQDEGEFFSTINSACSYNIPFCYKQKIENITDSLNGVCGKQPYAPQMPEERSLPPFIKAVIEGSPEEVKPALAMACFAPAACYTHELYLVDASERETEVAFIVNVVGKSGVGKSAIDHPIECLMGKINERDKVSRQRECEWKEETRCASKNKNTRRRPMAIIQNMSTNFTHAAYMQRMKAAEGHPLFIFTPELDALRAINDGKDPLSILRVMCDHAEYGQDRSSIEADSIKVKLYTHIVAASTFGQTRSFFSKGISKGNIGRLTVALVMKDKDDWGIEIPKYANRTPEYEENLRPYLEKLEQAHGTFNLSKAKKWQRELQAMLAEQARENNDEVYQSLIGRTVTIGFWRAMMLYIMDGQNWSKKIEDFCTWSVQYDLWCKMKVFGYQLRKEYAKENSIPVTESSSLILNSLPEEFTNYDLRKSYKSVGKTERQADNALAQWKIRKKIVLVDAQTQTYRKC